MPRQAQGGAINGAVVTGHLLSGAATGVVLSYVVPAGKQAKVTLFNVFGQVGTPTVQAQAIIGGVTVAVTQGGPNILFASGPALNPGDTAQINVTTLAAASTFDATICADEFAI